jgi:hypothetical protein
MLRDRVEFVRPKLHIFGHIHSGYGFKNKDGINYINASILDNNYKLINKPRIITI